MSARRLFARALLAALVPVGFSAAWGCAKIANFSEAQPGCADGAKDGDETGIDCGGRCLGRCPGERCATDGECASGHCPSGICVESSCEDLVWNGQETDLNCGGPSCAGCAESEVCVKACDCASGVCTGGRCQLGSANGRCDTKCEQCADNHVCNLDFECPSGVCFMHACKPGASSHCVDMVQNKDESDVDCGGDACPKCVNGQKCVKNTDCDNGTCTGNLCN